ncbi:NAD(P)H-hydrate epimerase [Nephila pilipes]|uniref:NAD(P)H-hydrate epimerase n=1 Tax=Nephila pilipes TaxID=299642 RepID=A0A8X6NUB4_NEPPI|nr:NAD(P)H-hydrate epimerase [Nephila pilipes]
MNCLWRKKIADGSRRAPDSNNTRRAINYISEEEYVKIEEGLLNICKYNIVQLIEMEGFAVASAIEKTFPVHSLKKKEIIICIGTGKNGAVGLVCTRYLKIFGYYPSFFYPVKTEEAQLKDFVTQCQVMDVPRLGFLPSPALLDKNFSFIIDALNDSKYKPQRTATFEKIIQVLKGLNIPICSVDVPAGWDMEKAEEDGFTPNVLVSLLAPKRCSQNFAGTHWVVGRVIDSDWEENFLNIPGYKGSECCLRLA